MHNFSGPFRTQPVASSYRLTHKLLQRVRSTPAVTLLWVAGILLGSTWTRTVAAQVLSLPATTVGQASIATPVTVAIVGNGVAADPQAVTQGVSQLDFSVAPGGTCAAGISYTAAQQCTVNVVFAPKYPGVRRGAVILKAADGTLLGETLIGASASGSLAVLVPGTINTVAGDGELNYRNDGIPATSAPIFLPYGVLVDPAGNIYLSDTNNNRVRRVDAQTGLISTIAGIGTPGYYGDGGLATSAMINQPGGLAMDGAGNIYFADSGNDIIRRIDAVTGIISTVAGVPLGQGYSGDGAAATSANLSSPRNIAFNAAGDMFIADTSNNVIRKVDAATGTISTVAGTGTAGYNGDTIPAISARLNSPWSVAIGPDNSLYIADLINNRIRKVTAGLISTVAGNGGRGFAGDNGPATAAVLNDPTTIVLDPAGNLYIADSENNRVRKVYADTTNIETVIGNDSEQFTGDGGPSNQATLYAPYALFLTQSGDLYISDTLHNRIRAVVTTQALLNYPVMRVSKTSSPQLQGLENDGNTALNLTAPAFNNAALDPATTTCSTTTPLAPSGNCNLGVEFAPTTVGNTVTGTVTLGSDAGNSPALINLSGQVLDVEPTTTTLTSSTNPSLIGQSVVLTATVASADPARSGPVTFLDGTTPLCSNVALSSGSATCTTSALALGPHSLTASYAGDTNNAASVSPALTQTVKQQPALALVVSPNPSTVTQSVTLSVTATASSGTPSGTVTFYDGLTALGGTVNLSAGGIATYSTSAFAPGQHSLSVQYAGDTTNAAGQSNAVTLTVNQATSVTTISSSNASALVGTPVVFTATVSDTNSVVPTGSVQFVEASNVLGSGSLDANGHVSVTLSSLAPGVHNISAVYSGDTNDAGSSSSPLSQTIQQIPTSTTVTSDANPASAGATMHFLATVAIPAADTPDGSISGTVTFRDGSSIIGTAPIDSSGTAGISVNTLLPGPHNIVATYPGNVNYAGSSSSTLSQTINSTSTTTTISSSAPSALAGTPVNLTANVVSPTGTPTGNVAFMDGATTIGHGTLNAQGVATFSTSTLTVASHAITAAYQGDGSYNSSSSTSLTEAISLATTALSLTSPVNTVNVGTSITFTTALTSNGVVPTGTVTLRDGNTALAVQNVTAAGTLSFNIATLSVNTHTLTAVYSGDSNNSPATSAAVTVTVQQAPTTTSLSTSATPLIEGQSLTLTAGVTSAAANVTGSVVFQDGGTTLGSVPLSGNGTAVFTTTSLIFGAHTLTAVYSGDVNHTASTSAAVPEQIVHSASLAVTSSANPATAGTNVIFTVKLSGVGSLVPTGSVVFNDGAASLGTVAIDATGSASFQTSNLTVGVHSVTVSYSGDKNYSASVSGSLVVTVQNANTQIALTTSANPASYSSAVALTATVTTNGGLATGSIAFTDGGISLGSAVLNSNGVAVLSSSSLAPGVHNIIATYAGDGKASASASSPLVLAVKQTTSVALATDGNPALTLSPVVITATVTNNGAVPATGSVTFTDGTTQLGIASVDSAGHATLRMPLFAAGSHSLSAAYSGDANDFPSASAAFPQVVQIRTTTTALTAAGTDPNNPQIVTLIGIVRWTGPAVPTGIITFTSGATVIGTSPIDGSGAATVNLTVSPGSTQNVSASYSGDESYGSSSSSNIAVAGGQATQFGLSLDPPSVSLQSKQHTVIHLTVSSIKGFADTVQLGCLGLPFAATCTFSNVQPQVAANGSATVNLTLDTGDPLGAGALVSEQQPRSSNVFTCLLPGGLLVGCLLFSRKRRSIHLLVLLVAAFAATLSMTGCAGLQMTGTPPGAYTFKITASGQTTGATVSQSFTLTVTQ